MIENVLVANYLRPPPFRLPKGAAELPQGVREGQPALSNLAGKYMRGSLTQEEHELEDGTKQKQVEKELRDAEEKLVTSERLLQTVFDTIPHNIFVRDLEGRFITGNATFKKNFVKPDEDYKGRTLDQLGVGTEKETQVVMAMNQEVMRTGEKVELKAFPFTLITGEERLLDLTKLPLRDGDGRIVGLVGFSVDVTEAVRVEEQLRQSAGIKIAKERVEKEKERSDALLHAILPVYIAEELKEKGYVEPKDYEDIAILICDIVKFTQFCEAHSPAEVISNLHEITDCFESVTAHNRLEIINVIGDSLMAAGGLENGSENPILDCVKAGLELHERLKHLKSVWQVRIGVHAGPVVAGVVGHQKFLFGLWGDTVNIASRMESNGRPGLVCLSADAWGRVSGACKGESQGMIEVKGKGPMEIYYVSRINP